MYMRIHVLVLLMINFLPPQAVMSGSDIRNGYQVTVAIPSEYTQGFLGRAFVMENEQGMPHFRAAVTVEGVEEKENYSCSLDVLLGNVRVWSSGHLSRFHTAERCVLELAEDGDLRLKDQTGRIGWRSGTSGQGVERLTLLRTGNLVLVDDENSIKWQSFNFPTDTMLWGQKLSSQTRLTSFVRNSTLFYSLEIQDDNIGLFLNIGNPKSKKYSYWEYQPSSRHSVTFVQLSTFGLEIFDGDHKFDQIRPPPGAEPIRFLAVDNSTGNLRMYYYSSEENEFKALYQAINYTCDLPLSCRPYGVCMSSGSCSCIGGGGGSGEGVCGGRGAEMVEVEGVVSVLRGVEYKGNVSSKEECGEVCVDECECLAAEYLEDQELCYVYEVVRGVKEGGGGGVRYMVKVGGGGGRRDEGGKGGGGGGLKRWVIIVVGVVDGFIIFVVLGGLGWYYYFRSRMNFSVRR
ncbi:EP1-like glycoprotein 3 [Andrographis paniculata]|uniref:EP1-like glycoprotein 3 n=1 Tax=Andrographis paniculata TaxID=175694 RepID=UPI0021E7CA5F|nr:EP1-like glycoprotein 3 [Andrographis paniculata]